MPNVVSLSFSGGRKRLGPALEQVTRELSAVPLAGLVVFTDGADNSGVQLSEIRRELAQEGMDVGELDAVISRMGGMDRRGAIGEARGLPFWRPR